MEQHRPHAGRRRWLGPVIGALLLGALAACGNGGAGEDPTPAPSPTESAESATTEPEDGMSEESTPYLDPSLGTEEPGHSAELTITGTVESGVESGCLTLEHDGTVYGIYGDYDSSVVKAGAKVTLSGHLEPDMMTTCQQGTPFVVEEAQTAD